MRTPPLLLGAALLFWGRETGMLALALTLAAAFEASRAVAKRLELSLDNQNRIADLCTAVFAVAAALTYATADPADAARLMLERSPLFFAPLLAAQAYGSLGGVDAGAFFWSLRRTELARVVVDLSFPYVGVCLLAAGGANTRSPAFYPCAFALAAWALWHQRPRWASAAGFGALLALAGGLGALGFHALTELQPAVEKRAVELAYDLAAGPKDVFQSRTAIGSIGELKRSGRILMRLRVPDGGRPPSLLRNAVYDVYKGRDWLAGSAFSELPGRSAEGVWDLAAEPPSGRALSIQEPLPGGQGALALPEGAFRVEGLPALSLRRSRLGAVVVGGGPSTADLNVRYGAGPSPDSPPSPADLDIPAVLRPTLARLAAALDLDAARPREAAARVERFFSEGFSYTLTQEGGPGGVDPMEDFLTRTKAGHCQHFATAAALLLRAAGIPTRYATGFAVLEYSALEGAWVVRRRHAHAWTRVYANGAWNDLDATPSSWSGLEEADVPAWQPLADVTYWLREMARRARSADSVRRGAMWGLGAVGLWLLWRLRGGLGALRLGAGRDGGEARGRAGADSELYAVEAAFGRRGLGRRAWETPLSWARRVSEGRPGAEALVGLARLHERYRFDPAGLPDAERRSLRDGAAALLADFDKTNA